MTAAGQTRLRATVAVALVLVLAAAVPSRAADPVAATDSGWYTSLSVEATGVPLGDPVAVNTLGPGDLPVAAAGQDEHKRSYLRLQVPDDATSLVIEVPLSASTGVSYGAPGPILACPVTDAFVVASARSIQSAPAIDCAKAVVGEPNADLAQGEVATAYRFDLTPLLARWTDPGNAGGFALAADVSEPQPAYQLTFNVELFEPIGAAESVREGRAPSPPPAGGRDSGEDPAPPDPAQDRIATGPLDSSAPVAMDVGAPEVAPAPDAPQVAEPVGVPPAAPSAAPPVVATVPLAAVNMALWVLALPLAAAALAAAGRSLRPGAQGRSTLDRLLGS